MKKTIYEADNFVIAAAGTSFVDRAEGAHLYLYPKIRLRDRTQLSPKLAIEYTKYSMIAGEALMSAMKRRGVDIGIINYQDMGNWCVYEPEGPKLHMQIYGRATTAVIQKYGEAMLLPRKETGFYDNFQPLDDDDIAEIRADIEKLVASSKYNTTWSE